MADNRKYYYLKLKESYFDEDAIVLLESMQDGMLYSLSGYIASSGKKYKNHAATIRRWAADDKAKGKPKKGIPDYSYKEGESL